MYVAQNRRDRWQMAIAAPTDFVIKAIQKSVTSAWVVFRANLLPGQHTFR
jgi:hypothetical protein